MARTRRIYTPEFKTEAVKLVTEQGYSVAEAARSLGLNDNLIRNWKQALQGQGSAAFPGQEAPNSTSYRSTGSLMLTTRVLTTRRARKPGPRAWRVAALTSSRTLRYFVRPCTRLARLTVLPSGPYLNLNAEPVLPTWAGPVFRGARGDTSCGAG